MENGLKKPVRIWVDGCFDMTHYGHFNALRQARAMGDYLVVGVHSDEEILKNKGPTVMNEAERYAIVRGCKWVDEVVENAPYYTSLALMDKYNCDYCVHGDDITTTADGTDCYAEVKGAGRYKECKRTIGVSTTELVGRMLLMTKDHHSRDRSGSIKSEEIQTFSTVAPMTRQVTNVSHFLPTSRSIVQFANGKEPKAGDKIIYADGGFDLYHPGHMEFLRKAKEMGDFLIVGVHDDATINQIYGSSYPVMNLHERVLSIMACRYVDEVIIGAPFIISEDVLEKVYKISAVVHGKTPIMHDLDGKDPYELAKKRNIYVEIDHPLSELSTEDIVIRIVKNRQLYEARNRRKLEKAVLEEKMLKAEQGN